MLGRQASDREAAFRDEGFVPHTHNSPLEPSAPVVATGEQGITGRRADAAGGVGIGEPHAGCGEGVQPGSRNLAAVGVVTP